MTERRLSPLARLDPPPKLGNAERQRRIELACDVAFELMKPGYYFDRDGERFQWFEFNESGVHIDYSEPVASSDSRRRLIVRYRHVIVLHVDWWGRKQTKSVYRPGEWGHVMRRYLRSR